METATKVVIEKILDFLEIFYSEIEVTKYEDNMVKFNIVTEDAPGLIGTHGNTLAALQTVVNSIMYSKDHYSDDEKIHIVIDVENYKQNREEKMFEGVIEKANRVRTLQKKIPLTPMNSYKRKLIHNMMKAPEYSDIVCESEGEGRSRHIVLRLKTDLDKASDLSNDEIF